MITQYDKAGVGFVAALISGLLSTWIDIPPQGDAAIAAFLTGFFVWLVPNSSKKDSLI